MKYILLIIVAIIAIIGAANGQDVTKTTPVNAGEIFGITGWINDTMSKTPGIESPSYCIIENQTNSMTLHVRCSTANEFQSVQYCGAYYIMTLRTYPNVGGLFIVIIAGYDVHLYHLDRQWIDDSRLADTDYLNGLGRTLAGTRDELT